MAAEMVRVNVEKLREFMTGKGWSTTKMAAEMGMTEASVWRVLNKQRGAGAKFIVGLWCAGIENPRDFLMP